MQLLEREIEYLHDMEPKETLVEDLGQLFFQRLGC